uniref:AAA+ ATPase domain-containing protein n=1 Tax=Alexandrium catenella TaxID=2925 RepID=A0A7S1Q674_ALECA|mmetsp:Transcript_19818/g.53900  ORF Transcript_19818/g.53900 Transcript_19818/m.53900 type:complete len:917 (+) Transcript_19818:88-2838(+)
MAKRSSPELNEFKATLTCLNFYTDVVDDTKVKPEREFVSVPLHFDDERHYIDTFTPLFWQEAKSQLHRSKALEMSHVAETARHVAFKAEGEWLRLDLQRDREEAGQTQYHHLDLVILTQGEDPLKDDPVHFLAMVDSSAGVKLSVSTKLLEGVQRAIEIAKVISQSGSWQLAKVTNLSTLIREFEALKAFPRINLKDTIINQDDSGFRRDTGTEMQAAPDLQASAGGTVEDGAGPALLHIPQRLEEWLVQMYNEPQRKAINDCRKVSGITLVQGPPGTGKTTTAVQIVSALVKYELVDLPMLVTADSNTAVDNLVKGIGKSGLKVVRVGRPESIREDVKQYALDGRWKELKKAEVVCATCIGASGSTLDKVRFSTVLIDECTQAAESAALVPIARGCQQCILIGDQCQLPPTVLSDVAENENLGESLFTRLVTQGVRPVLLDTQYRMHPLIAEFASAAFYNGRLQNGVSHIHRRPPEGFPWPQRQMPVAFVNLERGEEKREGSSYINPTEAEKTLWALQEVCKGDHLGPEDVGLVTPYKGQVNLIKKLIRERPGLQKFRSGLEVESVDGFQGQEKEVIIFCAVRNNRDGKVGFLSDWRRLNVMLTRARRGCIVIGSRSTLHQDALWQQWLSWATARGAICGEGAKGTWVPKYLVDDRDGVWQVKASLMEEVAAPIAAVPAMAVKVEKEKEPEILDSWEDMESPVTTPKTEPAKPPDLLEGLTEEDGGGDDDEVRTSAMVRQTSGELNADDGRAQELRAARFNLDPSDDVEDQPPQILREADCSPDARDTGDEIPEGSPEGSPGPSGSPVADDDDDEEAEDQTEDDDPDEDETEDAEETERTGTENESPERSNDGGKGQPTQEADGKGSSKGSPSRLDADDLDVRKTGTPTLCPKSPNRLVALAKLGLDDELDLDAR